MLDVKELEKTKRVNIVGEIPDVRLQILLLEQEQKLTSVIEKIIVFIIREL